MMQRTCTKVLVLFSLLILSGIIAGCSLFTTREAESPNTNRHTWETPRVPGDVLANMITALTEKDAANYLLSFDSQRFVFDPDPVWRQQTPFLSGWGYTQEYQHIHVLLSDSTLRSDSSLTAEFTSQTLTFFGDSAEIRADYTFAAGVRSASIPHRMSGTATFQLKTGREGYWQIVRWSDTRRENQSTWSDFKALVY